MLPTHELNRVEASKQPHGSVINTSFLSVLLLLFIFHILTLNAQTNLDTFNWFNELGASLPSWLLLSVTDLGDGITAGALILICLTYKPQWLYRVIVTTLLCAICVHIFKQYFDAPRPAALLEVINIIGKARYEHAFPSGHTTTAFALAGVIWLLADKLWCKLSVLMLAVAVGLSRIAVGAHWPEDIAFGAILGWLLAYLACSAAPLSTLRLKYQYWIIFALSMIVLVSELKNLGKDPFSVLLLNRYLIITALISLTVYMCSKFQFKDKQTQIRES
ncbi:phosphatase PAP2 family protein [Shewanella violacea]|uniref:undecaprenyl-diphosphate phosphatase n=1 Tax=Shewanella violacea (strain JCM 10179 / CIP 106290 / LMG 19151 / DSS12) TaxID=637905 RepID=D4ZEY7_SHEVD|nr:phosphatase PAP2 family protein [Shewanella violacea]BAJ00367.1 PAP2 family protein [Shewanella violacea DSS12]